MEKFLFNILQVFGIFSLVKILLTWSVNGIILEHEFHWHCLGYFFLDLGAYFITTIYLVCKRHLRNSSTQATFRWRAMALASQNLTRDILTMAVCYFLIREYFWCIGWSVLKDLALTFESLLLGLWYKFLLTILDQIVQMDLKSSNVFLREITQVDIVLDLIKLWRNALASQIISDNGP